MTDPLSCPLCGATSDAIRVRVLKEQALRARLAKKDMSGVARLRTLQAAQDIGLKLSGAQKYELAALTLDPNPRDALIELTGDSFDLLPPRQFRVVPLRADPGSE